MNTKRKSGQILILVLLVVVVSLAIGLSVASRNLSNLKVSSQTEQTQRAYTVSENGIESILAKLGNPTANPGYLSSVASAGTSGITAAGPADSSGAVSSTNVTASKFPERQVPLGEVMQIDLSEEPVGSPYTYSIMWGKKSSINECSKPASLEVTYIFENITNNKYQFRFYLQGAMGTDRSETTTVGTFNPGNAGYDAIRYTPATYVDSSTCATPSCTFAYRAGCAGAEYCDGYVNCAEFNSGAWLNLICCVAGGLTTDEPVMMRIRPIWNDTTINVHHGNKASYPASTTQFVTNQEYTITSSTSLSNGVTRKIQVTKSALPSVPAIFDFALYSETDIVK